MTKSSVIHQVNAGSPFMGPSFILHQSDILPYSCVIHPSSNLPPIVVTLQAGTRRFPVQLLDGYNDAGKTIDFYKRACVAESGVSSTE